MTSSHPASQSTVAVIVTWNPDPEILAQALDALADQCATVLVDNGSAPDMQERLAKLIGDYPHAELLSLGENTGIANAQNHAIRHAMNTHANARYTLLLDHDSIPGAGLVACLEETFRKQQQLVRVAAVGPVLYDPRDRQYLDFHRVRQGVWGKIRAAGIDPAEPVVEVDNLNSAGTLLANEVFVETGGFDSGLFIDHVETDWCFLARSRGYHLYATVAAQLTHHMGDDVCYYGLFRKRRMPYRSPQRHYYIVRNSLLLQRRDYVPLAWKLSNILKLLFTYGYFGWYYNDRAQQRPQINRGIRDGLRGVTGAAPQPAG